MRRFTGRLASGGEIVRFGLVTLVGLGVDLATAWVAVHCLGLPLAPAMGLGFLAGAGLNYALHLAWTFAGNARAASASGVTVYFLATSLVLGVRVGMAALLDGLFGGTGLAIMTVPGAVGGSFLVNFLLTRKILR